MLEAMLAETELRAFRGEKIVEVKPVWANKGEVLDSLLTVRTRPSTSGQVRPERRTLCRISKRNDRTRIVRER
jgi:hypothetical protein